MGKNEEEGLFNEKKDVEVNEKDFVSAWIKSVRLNRLQDSMYWLNIMSTVGKMSDYYIGLRMAAFAGEDCWDAQAITLTGSLMLMIDKKVPDIWNHIYFVNWYLCTCPKFWNTESGVQIQRELGNLEKRYQWNGEELLPEPLPSWAIDMHTSIGREAAKNKNWDAVDRRFSGDLVGQICRILMWKKYGRLDPRDGMDEFWQAMNIIKAQKPKEQE